MVRQKRVIGIQQGDIVDKTGNVAVDVDCAARDHLIFLLLSQAGCWRECLEVRCVRWNNPVSSLTWFSLCFASKFGTLRALLLILLWYFRSACFEWNKEFLLVEFWSAFDGYARGFGNEDEFDDPFYGARSISIQDLLGNLMKFLRNVEGKSAKNLWGTLKKFLRKI